MDDTKLSGWLARIRAEMDEGSWPGVGQSIESARAKDPDAVRYLMAVLVVQLRALSFPSSPVSIDLARFAADAFEAYLGGAEQTLDKAFGLAKGRGAPATATAGHLEIARRILRMFIAQQSWRDIANEASTKAWSVTDPLCQATCRVSFLK